MLRTTTLDISIIVSDRMMYYTIIYHRFNIVYYNIKQLYINVNMHIRNILQALLCSFVLLLYVNVEMMTRNMLQALVFCVVQHRNNIRWLSWGLSGTRKLPRLEGISQARILTFVCAIVVEVLRRTADILGIIWVVHVKWPTSIAEIYVDDEFAQTTADGHQILAREIHSPRQFVDCCL